MNEARLDHSQQVFRSLLWRLETPRLAEAVDQHVCDVGIMASGPTTWDAALRAVYRCTRDKVVADLLARPSAANLRLRRLIETMISPLPPLSGPDFHCDAALGGLARWLRAAGYDAAFWPTIDDDDLLRKMIGSPAILLTTDGRLCRRGVIASGAVPTMLVSIASKKREQFADTMVRLGLRRRPPRCMACGGRLQAVAKETVRDRIPPKTYPWRDDYYVCESCDHLFWRGTHWQRIEAELAQVIAPS